MEDKNDIKQECNRLGNPRMPEQTDIKHHALADARHNLTIYHFLRGIRNSNTIVYADRNQ